MRFDSPSELHEACSLIFGEEPSSPEFLRNLEASELRGAFRRQALANHPDRALILGESPKELSSSFKRLVEAYDRLHDFINRDRRLIVEPAKRAAPGWPKTTPEKKTPQPGRAADHSAPKTKRQVKRALYTGPFPKRPLMFGELLYFSGLITAREAAEAVLWQRSQRPLFGEIAERWGVLTSLEIKRVVSRAKPFERFGRAAVRLGLLSPFWVRVILRHQQKLQQPIGEYFLERGVIEASAIPHALSFQQNHNRVHSSH